MNDISNQLDQAIIKARNQFVTNKVTIINSRHITVSDESTIVRLYNYGGIGSPDYKAGDFIPYRKQFILRAILAILTASGQEWIKPMDRCRQSVRHAVFLAHEWVKGEIILPN